MVTVGAQAQYWQEQQIEELLDHAKTPIGESLSREEIGELSKDLECGLVGRLADIFPRFAYSDYEDWLRVASSVPYSYMHDTLEAADREIIFKAVSQIKSKRLEDTYSMGPNPSLDKLFLEQIVKEKLTLTYHAVDTNTDAASMQEIKLHLTARFGNEWEQYVKLDACPMSFEDVKSKKPSCVMYGGGTMMNNRKFWEQAARIARPGGIAVASSAVTMGADTPEYYLSIYDTPQGMRMNKNGIRKMLPELFTDENKDKWEVKFKYVTENSDWAKRWGIYRTPAISIEFHVKEPMLVSVADPITGKPVNMRIVATADRAYPTVLFTSSKVSIADFLQNIPKNFGFRPIGVLDKEHYTCQKIPYVRNGQEGHVVAAIFEVENPSAGAIPAHDLEPKMSYLLRSKAFSGDTL